MYRDLFMMYQKLYPFKTEDLDVLNQVVIRNLNSRISKFGFIKTTSIEVLYNVFSSAIALDYLPSESLVINNLNLPSDRTAEVLKELITDEIDTYTNINYTNLFYINTHSISKTTREELTAKLNETCTLFEELNGVTTISPNVCARFYYDETHQVYLLCSNILLPNALTATMLAYAARKKENKDTSFFTNELWQAMTKEDIAYLAPLLNDIIKERISTKQARQQKEGLDKLRTMLNKTDSVDPILSSIKAYQDRVDNLLRDLQTYYSNIRQLQLKAASYKGATEQINELIDFVTKYDLANVAFKNNTNSNYLYFTFRQPLLYWFDSDWETLFNNKEHNNIGSYEAPLQNLFNQIFLTKEITLYTNTELGLVVDMNRNKTNIIGNTSAPYVEIGNPHISHFNCWGANAPLITKAIEQRDYLSMWNLLKSTLSSVNLSDIPVLNRMLRDISNAATGSIRALIRINATGEQMQLKQYYDRLKEN